MHSDSPPSRIDNWLILSVGSAFLIAALIKMCLFLYPSVDDVQPLYNHLVAGELSSLRDQNLPWGRIAAIPLASVLEWLGFDHSALASLLFFPNEFLFALIVGLMIRRTRGDLPASVATALILCASLHPGFFEFNSYGSARITIFLSFCSLLALVYFWSSSPARNGVLCLVTSFIIVTSYQGALGLFIVLVGALVATEVARSDVPLTRIATMIGACMAGVLLSMALDFAVLEMLRSAGVVLNRFKPVSTADMAVKFGTHLSRSRMEVFGALTTPFTQNARLFVTGSLLSLALICLLSNWPVVHERGARFWTALLITIGGVAVASLQLTSLPFDYSWFPPRTYFWYFAGLVFVVACAVSVASKRLVRSIWFLFACWLPATVLLIGSVDLATSYSLGRARDFAIAHEIVSRLADEGFRWDRPMVIGLGRYPTISGTVGDMVSLLQPQWSGIYLLGLVARKRVLAPTPAQWNSGEVECSRLRPQITQVRVSVESEYALICF